MKPSTLAIAVLIATAAPIALASTASEREYQRGYNDCSQGRYDQDQHGESYKRGCRAAEDGQPAAAPAGHQGGEAKISDLKGMDSIKAYDVMIARGFNSVDTLTSGDALYGIYYNPKTGQCVQLANANDRVDSAVDIHTHPKCK
jgi:hypothetical protein